MDLLSNENWNYSDILGLLFIALGYYFFVRNMQKSKRLKKFLKEEYKKSTFPLGIEDGLAGFGFELYKEDANEIVFRQRKPSPHYWVVFMILVIITIISMPFFINISFFESFIFMLIVLSIYGFVLFVPHWTVKKKTFYVLNKNNKSFKKHINKGSN